VPDAENLNLVVATYSGVEPARQDFLRLEEDVARGLPVVGFILARRRVDGMADLLEPNNGGDRRHAWIASPTGVVVGLFAPELLLAAARDMGKGTAIGRLVKRHSQHLMGADLERYFPPGSSVVVAVVDGSHLDRTRRPLRDAERLLEQAIDPEDYEALLALVLPVVCV